jgi:hypothetical protein
MRCFPLLLGVLLAAGPGEPQEGVRLETTTEAVAA